MRRVEVVMYLAFVVAEVAFTFWSLVALRRLGDQFISDRLHLLNVAHLKPRC